MTSSFGLLIIMAILLLFAFPMIHVPKRFKNLFPATALRYDPPRNHMNFWFLLILFAGFVVASLTMYYLDAGIQALRNLPFVDRIFIDLMDLFDAKTDYILFAIRMVVINLFFLYAYLLIKFLFRFWEIVSEFIKKLLKKIKNKKKKSEEEQSSDEIDDADNAKRKKNDRVPFFWHSTEKDDVSDDTEDEEGVEHGQDGGENGDLTDDEKKQKEKKNKKSDQKEVVHLGERVADSCRNVRNAVLNLFFEGENHEFARQWTVRFRMLLRCFLVLVKLLYLLFLAAVLAATIFELPEWGYYILIDVLHIENGYIYPMLSILFLQELVNFLRTEELPSELQEEKAEEEQQIAEKSMDARLRKLLARLKKHFDDEHALRYYPDAVQQKVRKYEPCDETYQNAMRFIGETMEQSSGRVVQSYMQCLDASFGGNHIYFASSFYSELGGYLVAYTYIRLLSGARVIFVVSDPDEAATLRSYISERLIKLSGTSATNSWRIMTADEHLGQADVLIASPQDFKDGSIIALYPTFFEEVSNAVFLDCDRTITMDSYLCPVMATRLQRASNDHIRFIFLTQDLYHGLAARTLPKFFCVDSVLTFSSAKENESVSYVLWNRESKSHRIYNLNGQKTATLETMIANLACSYDVDGVRIMTESDLDHAERKVLEGHGVEINQFYRDVVDVNYMIYSDERCNLASSIYVCTRFRGKKRSVVHIISKPYMLREYFIDKAAVENFVNRSSFIQPRVPEHINEHKLSLLRILCDLIDVNGLSVTEFEKQVREVITLTKECDHFIASAFCRQLLKNKSLEELTTADFAAYMIAGLCDNDLGKEAESEAAAQKSYGHRA